MNKKKAMDDFEIETSSSMLLDLVKDIDSFNTWYLKERNSIMLEDGSDGVMTVEVMNGMLHDMVDMHIKKKNYVTVE